MDILVEDQSASGSPSLKQPGAKKREEKESVTRSEWPLDWSCPGEEKLAVSGVGQVVTRLVGDSKNRSGTAGWRRRQKVRRPNGSRARTSDQRLQMLTCHAQSSGTLSDSCQFDLAASRARLFDNVFPLPFRLWALPRAQPWGARVLRFCAVASCSD
jgi:hypothetical protein